MAEKQNRCDRHQDAVDLPGLCATCQRRDVELKIVEKTVDGLLAAGYALFVDGQGDDDRPETPTTDKAVIMAEMMACDDDYLIAVKDGHNAFIWFIYGNGGWDVISDYNTSLDPVLEPVMAFAETFDAN